MNKFLRNTVLGLSIIAALCIVAFVCLFKPLNTTPYKQCGFYAKTMEAVKAVSPPVIDSNLVLAGWAKVNLLPPFTTPIAIDDARGGKHFEGVHDSIYVRAFVFKQGAKKVAFVSADLLIIPPLVSAMLDTLMKAGGFDGNNIYFTATHSHASIGAWQNSFIGEKFAGKYDERVPAHIAQKIKEAIEIAEKNIDTVSIGYGQTPSVDLVVNRLVGDKGRVDSLIRFIKVVKDDGQTACMVTFSAHATVYHERMMQITRDWPGVLIDSLEKSDRVDFACFAAGPVGSHGPFHKTDEQEAEANYIATGVAGDVIKAWDSVKIQPAHTLGMAHVPLYLREPNERLSANWVLRPWVFYKIFGGPQVYINALRLGNVVLVGTPCDYSGELIYNLKIQVDKHLMVNSFNGGYIGYVTDDKWYGMEAYETKTMAWFGPGNGAYVTEVINAIVERM
jgi:neutral ceramidase